MTEEQNPREMPLSTMQTTNIPRDLKQYYLALLTRGPRWNVTDDHEAADLMPRQLAFIREQIEAKRYVVAGPVNEEAGYVGMMLVRAGSKDDALAIASADPGVLGERLAVEIYPVYLPSLEGVQVRY